jgi:hypothetical protein
MRMTTRETYYSREVADKRAAELKAQGKSIRCFTRLASQFEIQILAGGTLVKIKSDKMAVRIYARHGDTCAVAPHCKSLGCASGHEPDDYVLRAGFACLQDAIDYALLVSGRGVRVRLISHIVPSAPFISDYPKLEVR